MRRPLIVLGDGGERVLRLAKAALGLLQAECLDAMQLFDLTEPTRRVLELALVGVELLELDMALMSTCCWAMVALARRWRLAAARRHCVLLMRRRRLDLSGAASRAEQMIAADSRANRGRQRSTASGGGCWWLFRRPKVRLRFRALVII